MIRPERLKETGNEAAIRVRNLRKTFGTGDDEITAVDGVSFDISQGSVVGVLGPNGAGKTTTIKCLLGLVTPDQGTIEISGVDASDSPTEAYDHVGAMLEGARNVYWRLTVRENLSFFAGLSGESPSDVRGRHDRLLRRLDLYDRADDTVKELSRGMKQKVSLASTLSRDVDVVFLDEPTLGLDVETARDLRKELTRLAEEEEVTVVLCSHNMDVIEEVCDRVIVLNDGRVLAHEDVEELLDLFRTRKYRVSIKSPVDERLLTRLERTPNVDCSAGDSKTVVEVTTESGSELYEVMNLLDRTDQTLQNVESTDPDLEEVFLRITETNTVPDEPGPIREDVDASGKQEAVPGRE